MPTTAREDAGNLILDFGDGTSFTIHPVPGHVGIQIQPLLVQIALGTHQGDLEQLAADTELIAKLALGMPTDGKKRRRAPNRAEQERARRWREYDELRAARQALVSQAAILWNTAGGSFEAVLDLIDEAGGGYPKALGRVMRSSGLGDQYELLRTWLAGAAGTSETASTPSPTGGPSTSA